MTRSLQSGLARRLFALSILVVVAFTASPLVAAQTDPSTTPRFAPKENGEEREIEERREWFLRRRLDGVTSIEEARRLRALATAETAQRISELQYRRSQGQVDLNNFWSLKGPAGSHFGGWAFGDVSGRITAIAKNSAGTLFAGGAAGGVWRSTNNGLSWTSLLDQIETQSVGAIGTDPNDNNVIWVATGDYNSGCEGYFGVGVLRSTDGGLTWQKRNGTGGTVLDNVSSFAALVVDPRSSGHVLVAATARGCVGGSGGSGGIFTTDDAGATWTERLSGVAVYALVQDRQNRDNYWAGTNQGVYKSTNNGVSWVKQTASSLPSSNTSRTEVAIAPSNGNVVYALFAGGPSGNEFWRTTNGGGSWTKMSTGSSACDGQCTYNMTLAVHLTNPDTVYRGTVLVFKSTNGGAAWTQLTNGWGGSQQVHQDTQELLIDPVLPETLYIGSDGGVWRTDDGGSSFTCLNTDLNLAQFYAIDVHPTDPGIICGGAQDNSSLARPSATSVWELQAVTGDGFVCQINPVDPNIAYITSYPSGGPSVSRSTTGVFGSFSGITGSGSGVNSGDRWNWVTPYIVDPMTPNVLYLGSQRLYKSINHGSNWTPIGPNDMTGGSGTVYSIEVNRNFHDVVYAGTESGRVWRSADGGNSWTDITSGLPGRGINDLASDPTDPERVFAVVGGFNTAHLWEWKLGSGWIARGADLPNVPHNTALALTGTELFVGSDVGVHRSIDGGVSFTPYMDGLPLGLVVTDLKYKPAHNTLTLGSYARGAWQTSLDPVAPILIFDSLVLPLTEVDGDGDGSVEPGETFEVTPRIKNVGGLTAQTTQARLSTTTPGVTILQPSTRSFGDIAGGTAASTTSPYRFAVAPNFPCGGTIVFDLVDLTSATAPGSFNDLTQAFTVTVLDHNQPNIPTVWLEEDFDPAPPSGWAHNVGSASIFGCNVTWKDEWKLLQKDAAHGISYHAGNGPGQSYQRYDYSWLHHGGKDSAGGPGIDIPADAVKSTLTLTHWYNTQVNRDGGRVGIDAIDDNQDTYVTLVPVGGYDGTLNGSCNPLNGDDAFMGVSLGWVTDTFDLTPYRGKKIYLAFVFGSDGAVSTNEGWYIDTVKVDSEVFGSPVCQTTHWPGAIGGSLQLVKSGAQLQASWGTACNAVTLPGQQFSIQSGNLDTLAAGGSYDHVVLGSNCNRVSPALFSAGSGNEYYLVLANDGGHEGSAGVASNGTPRPQLDATCGAPRDPGCP